MAGFASGFRSMASVGVRGRERSVAVRGDARACFQTDGHHEREPELLELRCFTRSLFHRTHYQGLLYYFVARAFALAVQHGVHLCVANSYLALPKPTVSIFVTQPLHRSFSTIATTGLVPLVVTSARVVHSDLHFEHTVALCSEVETRAVGGMSKAAPPFAPCALAVVAAPIKRSAATSPVNRAVVLM